MISDTASLFVNAGLSVATAVVLGFVVGRATRGRGDSRQFLAAAILCGVVTLSATALPDPAGAWLIGTGWGIIGAAFARAWWTLRKVERQHVRGR